MKGSSVHQAALLLFYYFSSDIQVSGKAPG